MEKKARYCPSCGGKTNHYSCDICGRKTNAMSERHKEDLLDIIEDDMQETSTRNDFNGDQGHEHSKSIYTQKKPPKLHMEEGKHPYYEHTTVKRSNTSSTDAIRMVAGIIVIIMIIGFIGVLFLAPEKFDFEEETIQYPDVSSYTIYDDMQIDVSTNIIKRDGKVFAVLKNTSAYYVIGELDAKDDLQTVELAPTSIYELQVDSGTEEVTFNETNFYRFQFENVVDINYHEVHSNDGMENQILIDKDIKEEKLRTIGREMLAYGIHAEKGDFTIVLKDKKDKTVLYVLRIYSMGSRYAYETLKGEGKEINEDVDFSNEEL